MTPAHSRSRLFRVAILLLGLTAAPAALAAGAVAGAVSNAATRNLLEGARVEIPALGLGTLTDAGGRYTLAPVPAGAHEIVVSYLGLDAQRAAVTVPPDGRVTRDFDLTAAIYRLAEFRVVGEREGDAAAITAQRLSTNLRQIAATDSLGNVSNLNAGEVASRLPGISPSLGAGGEIGGFTIRGMGPGLNVITMDGAMVTSQGAMGRGTNINNLTSTMYDQIEVIKGHTPDKGADSLGGTINLRTRSPLAMRERRRVAYTFLARTAPPFTEQIPLRAAHRTHALGNLQYQELLDVGGGSRNLGIAVNLFSSEIALGWFTTTRDYQNTTAQPAYVWDYRTMDTYNHRRQKSLNARADYQLTPATRLSLLTLYVDHSEVFRRQYETRAYTGSQTQNTVPGPATSIVPGFTNRITQVRPVPTSTIDVTMTGPNNFFNRLRRADLGLEHTRGPLVLEAAVRHTRTRINIGNGEGAVLTNRLTGTGWILDRTRSDLYPAFLPNGGADFTDPANYRPIANGLSNQNDQQLHDVTEARLDLRYTPAFAPQLAAKAGLHWREQHVGVRSASRRWSYLGTGALPADPGLRMTDEERTGRRIPQWEPSWWMRSREVANPALWREDLYFRETTRFTAYRDVTETVTAPYAMAQGRLGRSGWAGRTGFLGGVRWERTENEADGWVRARALSTAAQQAADPAGAAQRDYAGNRRELAGGYTKAFPSVHAWHDWTANLKTRLAWSTSFGRPPFGNLAPAETPNENERTVTVSNPGLLPQIARNWDATLEYYFEPVGSISAGWFHKRIRDYIVPGIVSGTVGSGADNGFNGEYAGFTLLRSANAGTATVQGWEFSYQQQFSFLPGWLRGFSGMANYSVLTAAGDFGGRAGLSSNQVAGFIPRMGNASLSWRRGGFSTRVLFTYTGDYITSYAAGSAGRNIYRRERRLWNWGCAYQFRPSFGVTLDVDNLTNAPQSLYRGIPDQIQLHSLHGTTVSVGLNGRF
jgi:TonB-dependent receptor